MPILVLLAMDAAMAFQPGRHTNGGPAASASAAAGKARKQGPDLSRPPARPLARSTPLPLLISSHERQASSVVTRLIDKKRASLGSSVPSRARALGAPPPFRPPFMKLDTDALDWRRRPPSLSSEV
ncbi:hypothetical protein CH63R_07220 [Colletotrichum higginsianum IMI 349063]|uniref:Uncharacterized protein n=1 Tax=Colletotrichum higginsianum (strain IMI 349063) TaxID=759273 RepID=A0A1B7Y953_COLHI|nr:hypothetical protein CH63R_07220 [Colletotrichum higginsianum IMI 349063]OBR08455.1 hypothetical protein CH63R_07220 [Colletotrichum higginsianum IMI 349063]